MDLFKKENRKVGYAMAVLLTITLLALSRYAAKETMAETSSLQNSIQDDLNKTGNKNKVIMIDAGHGGNDPGKVGVNGVLEKEINLSIAKMLKMFLEANDYTVILTREEDKGLYEESDTNKKVKDMRNRVALMEELKPDLIISIHQNSYHTENVKGAQVFYYKDSKIGETLAAVIQKRLRETLDPENNRVHKANDSYFLLKKTTFPIVIVECGFLSNWNEAELLSTPEYQEKVAWAIHLGVTEYLNTY